MTVAEIPPQELGVRSFIEVGSIAARTWGCEMGLAPRQAATLVETAPTADGLDRNTVLLRVSGIAETGVRHAKSTVDDGLCSYMDHVTILNVTTDSRVVPDVGFEPTSPFGQRCLRPQRMPFRQSG